MLIRAVVALMLGVFTSAETTLQGFPNTITCKLGTGGTADISKAEIQKSIVGPKGTLVDNSAANVASGKCVTLSGVPLFSADVPQKGTISFAFDKAKDTYHFCSAQGAVDESGFPSACTEK
ncbi:hypothetical protein CCHL11_10355 [Colletotrichum chlorophyti]|uniref:Uncharacterized protein n=1 Tax=Colletotrichum chlorophyti TaxID=708187 RepID=A0A1Q8R9Z9_9PEZI|nr:hypothetical protein CCHL11_10355 [Colletotrichum chlorophyti]